MLEKIISGGQTGVDRIGLEVAESLQIPTGGTAPKNWWTEKGSDPSLELFGLVQSDVIGYTHRTAENVKDSDATVLFGDMKSQGSYQTIQFLKKYQKPYKENPTATELYTFIIENDIKILNVAGNRGTKVSTYQDWLYRKIMTDAFSAILAGKEPITQE